MKKIILTLAMLFALSIIVTSCRKEKKTPEVNIEAAIEDVKVEVKENSEKISDDIKDALEDVEDELKEVKEETE